MATIALVSVDPAAGAALLRHRGSPAGSPRRPGRRARVARPGQRHPLGVVDDPTYTQVERDIEPGSTLVLYTDGLVEARGEHLDRGLARLQSAVVDGPPELDALCGAVLEHTLLDPRVDDDVTMLALRTVSPRDPRVELRIPGNAAGLQAFRATTRRWLSGASQEPAEIDEITMAVNEAVQNAIEHGHHRRATPGRRRARAPAEDELRITIADEGKWSASKSRDRGRGLPLIRALMDDVTVDAGTAERSSCCRRRLVQPARLPAYRDFG